MKLRVLQVINKYCKRSGPEQLVVTLLEKLDKTRFESYVGQIDFSNFDDPSQLEEMLAGTNHFILIPWNKKKLYLDSAAVLSRVIREWNIDIVHCHDIPSDLLSFLARLLWRKNSARIITSRHGYIDYSLKLKVIDALDNILMRTFDKVIIGSESMRTTLPKLGKSRVILIPNAVSIDIEEQTEDRREQLRASMGIDVNHQVVTSVGRLFAEKGYEHLLHAAKLVCKQKPDIKFLIVGEGLLEDSLKELASTLGITDKIIFAGYQPSVQDVFAISDLFVLPSVSESLPLTLLEAMAYRLPVISTSVGGIGNVVTNRHNGLLVPPAKPEELSSAILELFEKPEFAEKLRDNGCATVQKYYSDKAYIRATEDCYESVAAR